MKASLFIWSGLSLAMALPGTSRPGEITPQPQPQQQPGQPNQR